MENVANASEKLCKFMDTLERHLIVHAEKNLSISKQIDFIKNSLNLYEVCVYELCNELNLALMDPISVFLKKLLLGYHQNLLLLIKPLFQGLLSKIPIEKLTEFHGLTLNKNQYSGDKINNLNKSIISINEGAILSKFDGFQKEITALNQELRKKERLIAEMHAEIQQNHLVQTKLHDLCIREIKTHITQKGFELHIKSGQPELKKNSFTNEQSKSLKKIQRSDDKEAIKIDKITTNKKYTKNLNEKSIININPNHEESEKKVQNDEIFFREFDKMLKNEMKIFELNLKKAATTDFTKKRYSFKKSQKLNKSMNFFEGDDETNTPGDQSPATKEFNNLLSDVLANKDKTLEGIKEAGVGWELNRILQNILSKKLEYSLRDSQINLILNSKKDFRTMSSSRFSLSVRNSLIKSDSKKKKKKTKKIFEKLNEIEKVETGIDPIAELFDIGELEAQKIEIILLKEKMNSLFQETKVLNCDIDKKNKEIKELKFDIVEINRKLQNELNQNYPLKFRFKDLEKEYESLKSHIFPLEDKLKNKKEKIKEFKKKISAFEKVPNFNEILKKLKETNNKLLEENTELKEIIENYKLMFKHGSRDISNESSNDIKSKFSSNKKYEDVNFLTKMNQNLREKAAKLERYLKDAEDREFSNEVTIKNINARNTELYDTILKFNDNKILGNQKEYDIFIQDIEKNLGIKIKRSNDSEEKHNLKENNKIYEKTNKTKNNDKKKIFQDRRQTVRASQRNVKIGIIPEGKPDLRNIGEINISEEEKGKLRDKISSTNTKRNTIINEKLKDKEKKSLEKKITDEGQESKEIKEEERKKSAEIYSIKGEIIEENFEFIEKPERVEQKQRRKSKSQFESSKKKPHVNFIPTNVKKNEEPNYPSDYLKSIKEKIGDLKSNLSGHLLHSSMTEYTIISKETREFNENEGIKTKYLKSNISNLLQNEPSSISPLELNKNEDIKPHLVSYPLTIPNERIYQLPIKNSKQKSQKNAISENKLMIKSGKYNENIENFYDKSMQTELIKLLEKECQTDFEERLSKYEEQFYLNEENNNQEKHHSQEKKSEIEAENINNYDKKSHKYKEKYENYEEKYHQQKEIVYQNQTNFPKKYSKSLHENILPAEDFKKHVDIAQIIKNNNIFNTKSEILHKTQFKSTQNPEFNSDNDNEYIPHKMNKERKDIEDSSLSNLKKWMEDPTPYQNQKNNKKNQKLPYTTTSAQNITISKNDTSEFKRYQDIYSQKKNDNIIYIVKKSEELDKNILNLHDAKIESIMNKIPDNKKKKEILNENESSNDKPYEILYMNLCKGLEKPETFMKNIPKSLEDFFAELLSLKEKNDADSDVDNINGIKTLGNNLNISKAIIYITIPEFKSFKKFMNLLSEKHNQCGKNCIHLQRFYEKLGVLKDKMNGREGVTLHKRDMNKLPKLFKSFGAI